MSLCVMLHATILSCIARNWVGQCHNLRIGNDVSHCVASVTNNNYKNKNWLQFFFIVKAAVLKQQI